MVTILQIPYIYYSFLKQIGSKSFVMHLLIVRVLLTAFFCSNCWLMLQHLSALASITVRSYGYDSTDSVYLLQCKVF